MKKRGLFILTLALFISGCDFKDTFYYEKEKMKNNPISYNQDNNEQKDTLPPQINAQDSYRVNENQKYITTITITDQNLNKAFLSGEDASLFKLYLEENSSNQNLQNWILEFINPPVYDNPQDINQDNIYKVTIIAIDDFNNSSKKSISIEVLKDELQDNNNSNDDNNSNDSDNDNNESSNDNNDSNTTLPIDSDNDYIPNNIETMLGMDPNNSDQNSNNIIDGLDTQGNYGDTFFDKEWYIHSEGVIMNKSNIAPQAGNDLNLLEVYKEYMGYNNANPIIVQVVDTGVEANHEDLKENIDLNRSFDTNSSSIGDPTPNNLSDPIAAHGTMAAGIVAARAFNGIGVRGVAPFAKIAGANWLETQSAEDLEKIWSTQEELKDIPIVNNSWGTYFTVDTLYEEIMEKGVENRDGKGKIYIFAAGNDRENRGDTNLQYVINNQYAIAVSALSDKNKYASYATPGANIWISAYGGAQDPNEGPTIATTTLMGKGGDNTWDEDVNKNYTYAMAGTSAAAPMVSGIAALILEACPNLSWRDFKYLIAVTAKKIDENETNWIENGAGHHFNINYGFGLINAIDAIKECKSKTISLPAQSMAQSQVSNLNLLIPDNNETTSVTISFKDNLTIEWVQLIVDNNSTNASDYEIYLTSPSGTKVKILQGLSDCEDGYIPSCQWMDGGFRFSTGAFLDEKSQGDWKMEIRDLRENSQSGYLKEIKLQIYGH